VAEPLSLPPEEMRRLGYRVVDRIVEHLEGLRELPPVRVGEATQLRERVGGPPPEAPGDPDTALDALFDDVLPFIQHGDHPRFFARIGSPSNYMGVLADAAAAGFNVFTASWTGGSGPATVELVVLDWLRELCGLPEGGEGVLVSGGSVATLVALAAARTARLDGRPAPDAVVYVSDQTHSAVGRALRVLGFDGGQLRVLPADERFRLDAGAVCAAIEADRGAGRRPFCVAATAGTTSTGAVDPLDALADLCAEQGLWLHVDGAYGAPGVLWPAAHPLLAGLERADSLVLDPHKWLFQPYEVGCLLVREPGLLERTFALGGVYLRDVLGGEVNFRDRSVQLTRGARALKLWLSIRVFGLAAFRAAIGRGIGLAEHAEAVLRARPGWEVVTPAQLAVVCFRRAGDDALQTRIAGEMVRDGYAAPSTTELAGRVALRLCTINPRTTPDEIERTIERMEVIVGRG
jgi:aromatic-L-amino-acid decarboxylase